MPLSTLERLWAIADEEAAKVDVDPDMVFDPIGLLLIRPPTTWEYFCTPLNSLTFAHTGGDGVHYGLLQVGDTVNDESPVVMSVPGSGDNPNLILGASLHEFLCLGCRVGYFWLEQLVYNRGVTLDQLLHPEKFAHAIWFEGKPTLQQTYLLARFAHTFDLRPWEGLAERLVRLQDEYLHLVRMPHQSK